MDSISDESQALKVFAATPLRPAVIRICEVSKEYGDSEGSDTGHGTLHIGTTSKRVSNMFKWRVSRVPVDFLTVPVFRIRGTSSRIWSKATTFLTRTTLRTPIS